MLHINLVPFPIFTSSRIVLRRMTLEDDKELFQLRSSEEAMKYIGRPAAKTIEDVHDLVNMIDGMMAKEMAVHWAITLKSTGKLIGTVGFWQMSKPSRRSEIGYMLIPEYHRQGIMQEALNFVLDYGFDVIRLHSIEARTSPDNEPSMKLLERNDFVKEGHLKENFYFQGKFWDTVIFSKINPKE